VRRLEADGQETTVLTRVETTTVVPTSSVSAGGLTAITVEKGEAVDGPVKIVSAPGDKVRLSVSADSHSTVSVGNLVDFSTIPGGTVSMTFVPDGAGTFPIDLHGPQSLTRIGTLVVQE
jgi:hypothetical protein